MIKKFFLLICFSLLSVQAYAKAPQDLSQLLINTRTMQAHFSQTIWDASGQLIHRSAGTMALVRPGRFRWEVTQPVPQLIVVYGRKLWIYDKDLAQLTIRPLSHEAGAAPAQLLSDESLSFEKEFYVKPLSSTSKTQWFLLTPKDKSTFFAAIKLGFVKGIITEMHFNDHLGKTIVIKFTRIQTNQPLSPALFQVRVPSNVDVMDETLQRSGNH